MRNWRGRLKSTAQADHGGASAYSRVIDFARFRAIADSVGAVFLVDMAHYSGLDRRRRVSESLRACGHRHVHNA